MIDILGRRYYCERIYAITFTLSSNNFSIN
jgi:hypothetical protein